MYKSHKEKHVNSFNFFNKKTRWKVVTARNPQLYPMSHPMKCFLSRVSMRVTHGKEIPWMATEGEV